MHLATVSEACASVLQSMPGGKCFGGQLGFKCRSVAQGGLPPTVISKTGMLCLRVFLCKILFLFGLGAVSRLLLAV